MPGPGCVAVGAKLQIVSKLIEDSFREQGRASRLALAEVDGVKRRGQSGLAEEGPSNLGQARPPPA